ncbi:hypothetical protein BVG19_g3324 [[Candida] boidinii]|nr:hypothetical protein BVG19_g3324 [[Candida] boidinii]OWB52135.1 hypothetical protein B5S27_g3707 [[Candida] boidinii]
MRMGIFSIETPAAHSDPALAEHGVDQANELANYITKELNPKPKIIISSPFYRCIQTANPTANSLRIPIFLDKGVGEFYKKDRAVIPEPASLKTLQTFFPNVSNEWQWDTVVPSNSGEDESDIFNRCSQFWDVFFQKFESQFPNIETVMFISHAATKIALGMTLLKGYESVRDELKDEDNVDGGESKVIKSGTCAIDKYVKDDANGGRWSMKINGYTDYLEKGEEMNWHFISNVEAGSDEDIERRRKLAEEGKLAEEEKLLKGKTENDDLMDIDSEKVDDEDDGEDEDDEEDEDEDDEDEVDESDEDDEDEDETEEEDEDEDDDAVKKEEYDDEEYEDVFVKLSVPPKGRYSDKHSIGSTAFQMLSGNTNNGRPKTDNRYSSNENTTNSNLKSSKNALPKLMNSRLYAPITSSSTMQIVGMETDKPILQIDKEVFEGDWGKLIGTELIFNDSGDCVTKVDGHLTFKQGKLLPKSDVPKNDQPKKKETLFVRALKLAKSVSNNDKSVSGKDQSVSGKDKSENKVESEKDAETVTQTESKSEKTT